MFPHGVYESRMEAVGLRRSISKRREAGIAEPLKVSEAPMRTGADGGAQCQCARSEGQGNPAESA